MGDDIPNLHHCERHCVISGTRCCKFHCRIYFNSLSKSEQSKLRADRRSLRQEKKARKKEHTTALPSVSSFAQNPSMIEAIDEGPPPLTTRALSRKETRDVPPPARLPKPASRCTTIAVQRYLQGIAQASSAVDSMPVWNIAGNLCAKPAYKQSFSLDKSGDVLGDFVKPRNPDMKYSTNADMIPRPPQVITRREHRSKVQHSHVLTDDTAAMLFRKAKESAPLPIGNLHLPALATKVHDRPNSAVVIPDDGPPKKTDADSKPQYSLKRSRTRSSGDVAHKCIPWDWDRAHHLITQPPSEGGYSMDMSEFVLHKVPASRLKFESLTTLGAKKTGRSHKIFRAHATDKNSAFLKLIPYDKWEEQFTLMKRFFGEWVTDGENFVMEACILAELAERKCDIVPTLYCVANVYADKKDVLDGVQIIRPRPSKHAKPSHIAIVSEVFGSDLHTKLTKYRRKYTDLIEHDQKEKAARIISKQRELILQACALLEGFHAEGFCHLDFTAENILIGPDPSNPKKDKWKLCDFGKATIRFTKYLRHVTNPIQTPDKSYPFESCEPTIGKTIYIPPECNHLLSNLDEKNIYHPCVTYDNKMFAKSRYGMDYERNRKDRAPYYFIAESADIYELMVLVMLISIFGGGHGKSVFPPAQKRLPIFDQNVLAKLKQRVPNNSIWDNGMIEMLQKNTQNRPDSRHSAADILVRMSSIFKAIRQREKRDKVK